MAFTDHNRKGYRAMQPSILKTLFGEKKGVDGYADFGDFLVYDKDVGKYARKHMRFIDWLDPEKVGTAMMYSFSILSKSVDEPNIKNGKWKFFKDI